MHLLQDEARGAGVSESFDFWGFVRSIDWTERWIIILMLSHIGMFLLAFISRRRVNVQCALFLGLLAVVYFSEELNKVGAKHWRSFSSQQYFDSQGFFISIVFSMPILLNCILIVAHWLWLTNGALHKVIKQDAEIKHRLDGRKKQ